MCECTETEFSARASAQAGSRLLQVEGTCTCPTSGFQLELEFDNPGIVPQPEEVVLRLIRRPPEMGADVLTPTPVHFEAPIGDEAKRVVIRVPEQATLVLPIIDEGYTV